MSHTGKPIQDISITKESSLEKIFEQMSKSGGFESRNLADGLDILTVMMKDNNCQKFLSFVGAIISTGLRGIIKDMIKNKWFNTVITNMWGVRS